MTDADARTDPEALLAHGDFVRAVARSLLWDEHAAEDVVQQTWLAALGAPVGAHRGWLAAVARNLAIKRIRGDRRRALRETAASRPEATPSDADVLERERLRRSVVDEVLALPEPYRATVLLRYLESLPPRDVARRMDVPVETVRTRTRRALEMLRVRLDARQGDHRGAFCAALAVWAGPPRGGTGTAATGTGGLVMGTKTIAAGIVLVAGVAAWLLWPRDAAPVATKVATSGATAAAPAERPAAPPRARTPAEERPATSTPVPSPTPVPTPEKRTLRGRVADSAGRPVEGAMVIASGAEVRSFPIRSGADGRFELALEPTSTKPVAFQLKASPKFEPVSDNPREVTSPTEEVVFVVERRPTATLIVSAYDGETGQPTAAFSCDFGADRPTYQNWNDGKIEAVVRLTAAAGDTIAITAATQGGATGRRDVAVRDGDRVEVRVDLQREGEVRGRVVDAADRPVANALVFFGEEDVARGDEPFKPFDEKRVKAGARTDADGRFQLSGAGRWITFWTADAGPVTVARGAASSVVLPARGTIRGVLRGADGRPEANRKVYVDRVRETTTDAGGRFEFANVEPGTRGLSLTGGKPKAYFAVRVAPGATVDVELKPGLASVRIEWPGRQSLGRFVALVALDAVGSMAIGEPADGAYVAKDVLPGRYLLFGDGGALATADVSGATATAVVGTGEIVIHAKAKTRVYVVPAGAGYLVRLLAGRGAGAGVPADGVKRFTGLAPGRYEVGVERDGVRTTVEVKDGAVETTIE